MMLAAPTILAHGTLAQQLELLPGIANGQQNWCQLFSEPGSGSDLASLRTRATPVEGGWLINGQKVWTSNGHLADLGMLLARTDAASSGRRGIAWMAIDMHQPGIDVRPLREMTGRSLFTEVFLDGAFVRDDAVVGGPGSGWAAARTTLASERIGLSEGGAVTLPPGAKGGFLDRRAGDVAAQLGQRRRPSGTSLAMRGRAWSAIEPVASTAGLHRDQQLRCVRLAELERVAELMQRRAAGDTAFGSTYPSLGKLLHSRQVRLARDTASDASGLSLVAYDDADQASDLRELVMFAPAVSIYGGSDEIQKNLIAERLLGLPRDSATS